jgi:hypothetical protein
MKLVYVMLLGLFIFGCSEKNAPVQVKGELKIGQYIISPPINYWHFPREYPPKHKSEKNGYILTFYKDKETINAIANKDTNKLDYFINFGIFENKYKNNEEYYSSAKAAGRIHKDLPNEVGVLLTNKNWSCKQTVEGLYGIECISLGSNIVTIGAYGYEEKKVLSHISLLQKMLESFKDTN